nr:DNA-directed RNA polymerase subunit delta [Paenibacillus sediminis]
MVDLAFMVLKAANTPYYYRDLMNEVAKLRGLSDEQINDVIAQLYTEINIDGRFACVGTNLWGLKRWYPVDKSEDALSTSKHPRIINDDDDDLDDDDFTDEEDAYVSDDEDFDVIEDDQDELYPDEDDTDVEDDVLLDDEALDDEEVLNDDSEDDLDEDFDSADDEEDI